MVYIIVKQNFSDFYFILVLFIPMIRVAKIRSTVIETSSHVGFFVYNVWSFPPQNAI